VLKKRNPEPLGAARGRGINVVVGTGEQSETRSRELALRAAKYAVPVRYLSNFDPGGRSMPKAVARKVEFTIHKFNLDVDFQLIPVGALGRTMQRI
jgi:hypothetical protein